MKKLQIQQPPPRRDNLNHDDNNKSSSSSSSTTKITTRVRYLEEVINKLRANKKVRFEFTIPNDMFRAVRSSTKKKKKNIYEPDDDEHHVNNIADASSNNNEDDIVPDDPHEREVLAEIIIQSNQTQYVLRRIDEEKVIKECSLSNPDDNEDSKNEL